MSTILGPNDAAEPDAPPPHTHFQMNRQGELHPSAMEQVIVCSVHAQAHTQHPSAAKDAAAATCHVLPIEIHCDPHNQHQPGRLVVPLVWKEADGWGVPVYAVPVALLSLRHCPWVVAGGEGLLFSSAQVSNDTCIERRAP